MIQQIDWNAVEAELETCPYKEMSQDEVPSPIDPIPLAISMLEDCDRFACDALTKYIHKIHMWQTDLKIDDVDEHQQKIRIVIKRLKGEG